MEKNGSPQMRIPPEAFKTVQCKCGSKYFDTVQILQQYPGGLWSAKRITMPVTVMICMGCGEPYDDKNVTLLDNKKEE
jgi:hypothetical protein